MGADLESMPRGEGPTGASATRFTLSFPEVLFLAQGFRACTPEQTERSFHIVLVLVKASDWPCSDVLDLCKVIDSPGSPGVKVCWSV